MAADTGAVRPACIIPLFVKIMCGLMGVWTVNLLADLLADAVSHVGSFYCCRGHVYPVWDVAACPHGSYLVSGGSDRTARLWSTEHARPLRIYAGAGK
jgi:WD40 repeat protein